MFWLGFKPEICMKYLENFWKDNDGKPLVNTVFLCHELFRLEASRRSFETKLGEVAQGERSPPLDHGRAGQAYG